MTNYLGVKIGGNIVNKHYVLAGREFTVGKKGDPERLNYSKQRKT